MKKTSYSNLSKNELYLISRAEYENQKVITSEFSRRLFKNPKRAAEILYTLTKKKRLVQLERGKYLLVPIKAPNQQWMPNELMVAKLWLGDISYYIGYFTMYQYWGLTEQVPQTIYILNTKKSVRKIIGAVKYEAVKIDAKKYFGVQEIKVDDELIKISDRERTLVDFIFNPIGSFENIEKVLRENINKIDPQKFIKYLIKFPVVSVRKRAGFILEKIGVADKLLKQLRKNLGNEKTYVVLDPTLRSRKGPINKRWQIIVNR